MEFLTKDHVQFLRRHNLELRESTVLRTLILPPPSKLCHVAEAVALHVFVRHLNHKLRTQRNPRKIFALAPTALSSRKPLPGTGRPCTPRMTAQGILPVWLKEALQLAPFCLREAGADANMLQVSAGVV